jgi:hypothetical protein
MLKKYEMTDRARIVHADVRTQAELLSSADVIIMNNVFDAFLLKEDQKNVWYGFPSSLFSASCLIFLL